ncbi:MAG TPA: hypothetical protein VK686_04980 [Bryobacteraceae bacterium]|nr:hypothetical protein [Bryobacteraceae bacterium]
MKMNKLMLGACVFSLGIATAASTYHLRIADPMWVGQSELKPGEYEVRVDGDKVTFKQGKNVFAVTAKVETNAAKYSDTQMDVKTENGQSKLRELDLGGTKSKIMLTDATAVEAGGTK